MHAFLVMITIAPLFWAFTWLLVSLLVRLPLDSLWRKIFILIYAPGMMITFAIQGTMGHVGHPPRVHAAALVWAIAVDCFPALAIVLLLTRNQQKPINDGRLDDGQPIVVDLEPPTHGA